jgi:hypothetical protein
MRITLVVALGFIGHLPRGTFGGPAGPSAFQQSCDDFWQGSCLGRSVYGHLRFASGRQMDFVLWHVALVRAAGVTGLAALAACFLPTTAAAACPDAESAAQDVETYARRAYRETSFNDAQDYMRRAKNSADDAQSAASDCRCPDAESAADDAYTYARRGYNASSLRELTDYALRTMRAAQDTQRAAQDCPRMRR